MMVKINIIKEVQSIKVNHHQKFIIIVEINSPQWFIDKWVHKLCKINSKVLIIIIYKDKCKMIN
jgi:hypothetical protein